MSEKEKNELDLKQTYEEDDAKGDFASEIATELVEQDSDLAGFMVSDNPEEDFALDLSSESFVADEGDDDMDF